MHLTLAHQLKYAMLHFCPDSIDKADLKTEAEKAIKDNDAETMAYCIKAMNSPASIITANMHPADLAQALNHYIQRLESRPAYEARACGINEAIIDVVML
jgi:hypothetical protein